MRHLLACPACAQQYDVSDREPGSKLRCACGEAIEVRAPRAHDAAVVRCSSCGAPRQEGAPACSFCGADFTLHERDLHTICPQCMTRIADRSRFCHSCGVPIAPQSGSGVETTRACPACGEAQRLVSRSLDGERVTVLECGRCAGLWLGSGIFRLLEERAQERETALDPPAGRARGPGPSDGPRPADRAGEPLYRPCPDCSRLMHRRNYGRKSGVIVDTCQDHGIWFDPGELDAVLDWVRAGGPRRVARAEEAARRERQRHKRLYEPSTSELEVPARSGAGTLAALVGRLLDLLAGLR